MTLQRGDRLLIVGPSGCGKSTLLRAIAGIWPYGAGAIGVAANANTLFLPQRSYIPIGTLRGVELPEPGVGIQRSAADASAGKLPPEAPAALAGYLRQLEPSPVAGRATAAAFARALLIRPSILFLDEATSALDDETEQLMYCLLVDELPEVTLISVAHRSVAKYHQTCWRFSRSEDQPARLMLSPLPA
ncbi:ATP-binding cassette domain-containing protein [Serratia ureilytica]